MQRLGLASLLPALVAGCFTACGGVTHDNEPSPAAGGSAGSGGGAVTGGSGGYPVIETPGQPEPLSCNAAGSVSLTSGLKPEVEPDFLGLYQSTVHGPGMLGPAELIQSSGELCSSASDRESCEAAAAALDPEVPGIFPDYWGPHYAFVYTRGDEVGFIYDTVELRRFLGVVDTPNEAAVILWSIARAVSCDTINEDESGYYARGSWQVSDCPFTDQELLVHVDREGNTEQTEVGERVVTNQSCAGRRPTGLVGAPPSRARSALGRYFAELAHLESAAVVAFAILERELEEHGAPAELVAAARKSLGDEVRHTEIMGRLAKRFAARPAAVELEKRSKRGLLEIALENAVEGCVRETYGALQAHYQASCAEDPEVRTAWTVIAPDETEHAELSHALHRWLMPRLSAEEQREVERAMREALAELRAEVASEPDPELVSRAGMPDAARAARLIDGLERTLFSTLLAEAAA